MATSILAERQQVRRTKFRGSSTGQPVISLPGDPPLYVVVVRGRKSEVLGMDMTWDEAVALAGAWNMKKGSRESWAWIEPLTAEGRKAVAA